MRKKDEREKKVRKKGKKVSGRQSRTKKNG